MGDSSATALAKSKDSNPKKQKQPFLDARRRSELVGFLVAVAGILAGLSLWSFRPEDPSFNTAAPAGTLTQNWIGPVGAYSADLLFQGLGWVACLIPVVLLVVGGRFFVVKPFATPKTKAAGAVLLVVSLSALLELFPYTGPVKSEVRGSGLLGYLAAEGLKHTFNRMGAAIVAAALLLSSLFLVTRFSFSAAASFLKARWQKLAQPVAARWAAWQEARAEAAAERRRRQAERQRILGKPPIITPQRPGTRLATPAVNQAQLRAAQPETPRAEAAPPRITPALPAESPDSPAPGPT